MQSFFQAANKLTRGVLKVPLFWAAFIQLLILLHGILPLVFLPSPTAVVVLVCFYAGALTMTYLTMRFGFSRILGAAHIWWVPMFVYLVWEFGRISPEPTPFRIWYIVLLIIQPITLFFDILDVTRWLRGDRAEMVPNL